MKNQEHIPSIMTPVSRIDAQDLVVDIAVDQVVVQEADIAQVVDHQIDLPIALQDQQEIVLHTVLTDQQDQPETDHHMAHHVQVMEVIDQDEIVLHMVAVLGQHMAQIDELQEAATATDQQDQPETDHHMVHHVQVMEVIDQDEIALHMVAVLDHHVHRDQNVDHMIDSFEEIKSRHAREIRVLDTRVSTYKCGPLVQGFSLIAKKKVCQIEQAC